MGYDRAHGASDMSNVRASRKGIVLLMQGEREEGDVVVHDVHWIRDDEVSLMQGIRHRARLRCQIRPRPRQATQRVSKGPGVRAGERHDDVAMVPIVAPVY